MTKTPRAQAARRGGRLERGLLLIACGAAPILPARSQDARRPYHSVDWHGPTVSKPDSLSGAPITEGDVLVPAGGSPALGPLPPPSIAFSGASLGLVNYNSCSGHQPGEPCGIEVDALSFGTDASFPAGPLAPQPDLWFSVDEYGSGFNAATGPDVATESPGGDSSCDLFVSLPLGPAPHGPGTLGAHTGVLDGNGQPGVSGFVYPGLGLVEPNLPGAFLPNAGDNVDAFNLAAVPATVSGSLYFSLDAGFSDPLSGASNSNSAPASMFQGADVLRRAVSGGPLTVYAPASALGLDQFGPGTDDLDALILHENSVAGFQASSTPFDWNALSRDMLIFSVRRNSAVVGRPDSLFGAPIEPGDLLIPPVSGGLSPFPAIFVSAEALGLRTRRQLPQLLHGDDLNACDSVEEAYLDCNGNGIEDSVDIATGASEDDNRNGIPDECELDASRRPSRDRHGHELGWAGPASARRSLLRAWASLGAACTRQALGAAAAAVALGHRR